MYTNNHQPSSLLSLFLEGNDLLDAHGAKQRATKSLALIKRSSQVSGQIIRESGKLDVIASLSDLIQQRHVVIVSNVQDRVLLADHVGDTGGMSGGDDILILLVVEDVNGGEVTLGMSVLSGLGSGHVNNLGSSALDHDVAALSDLSGLGRVGQGATSITGGEIVIFDRGHCREGGGVEERK